MNASIKIHEISQDTMHQHLYQLGKLIYQNEEFDLPNNSSIH